MIARPELLLKPASEALQEITQDTARVWLTRLVEQGHATRKFVGIKGQHGGRMVVYRRRDPDNL